MSAPPIAPPAADTAPMPLVLGAPAHFALVRQALADARYTEAEVVRRCAIDGIHRFRSRRDGRTAPETVGDAFDALLRLFMDEEPLPWAEVRAHLGDAAADALRALDLLADADEPGACWATVLLYPARTLVLASDRTRGPRGEPLGGDVVFPAITANTGHFVGMLPAVPCAALLELCAGTGIAALLAAPYTGHVWATDITARSVHFARFNAALNGIENVTVARGDLYEAVGDLTFDRIVAHPPYVPEPEVRVVFRDGGEDGEQVTRGIVAGLPRHLRPGGTLQCTCAVTDRAGRPFEQRVREWLGDAADEFDVFFLPQAVHDALAYYLSRVLQGHEPWETLQSRHETFRRLEVERVAYGSFVVRRRGPDDPPRPPLTVRRRATPATVGADVLRLIDAELSLAAPGVEARTPDLRLRTTPATEFSLTHALVDGEWQATACHVRVAHPFVVDASVAPWVAALLARADGARTPRAIVAELQAEGMAPEGAGVADELAPLLRAFLGTGILAPA